MKIFRSLEQLPRFRNPVLTIGSFDGVHAGHQKILESVQELARAQGGESVVISFHPHPRLVVYPQARDLHLLSTTEEKILLLERYGVDNVVIVPFTVEFSRLTPDEYIVQFLVGKFHPRCVVIGYDHRFGLNRQGDINFLRWYGKELGFEVVEIPKQEVDAIAISSTKIREALLRGDVEQALRMLNHPYLLIGRVVPGNGIGKTLGFPTANLQVSDPHKLIPAEGIYAVRAHFEGQPYQGMLYIGRRPTLNQHPEKVIEVHLFDFDQNIYGEELQVEFLHFLRRDASFANLEQLAAQLARDREAALGFFRRQAEIPGKA